MATIYSSTDTGAPAINNVAGGILPVFDAILVDGYGSKPGAGWTKEFTGTNKAAYRNGASALARSYMRVDDSSASGFVVRGYDSMTGIDSGTGPFPTPADVPDTIVTPRRTDYAWYAIADARTLVFCHYVSSNYGWAVYYFGDGVSAYDDDQYFSVCSFQQNTGTNSWSPIAYHYSNASAPVWTTDNAYTIKASRSGAGPLLANSLLQAFRKYGEPYWNILVNPSDGRFWLSPIHVIYAAGAGISFAYRGRLRFVYFPGHMNLSEGAMIQGAGELAGKSFVVLKVNYISTGGATYLALTADE